MEDIKTETYDLMLMDIVMPRMNGVEVLKQLKEIDSSVIVIMMTAYTMPDVVEGALREGVYRVLFRPLDMEEVPSLIDGILSSGNGGDPSLN